MVIISREIIMALSTSRFNCEINNLIEVYPDSAYGSTGRLLVYDYLVAHPMADRKSLTPRIIFDFWKENQVYAKYPRRLQYILNSIIASFPHCAELHRSRSYTLHMKIRGSLCKDFFMSQRKNVTIGGRAMSCTIQVKAGFQSRQIEVFIEIIGLGAILFPRYVLKLLVPFAYNEYFFFNYVDFKTFLTIFFLCLELEKQMS